MRKRTIYMGLAVVLVLTNVVVAKLTAQNPPPQAWGDCWRFQIGGQWEDFCLETEDTPECHGDDQCGSF